MAKNRSPGALISRKRKKKNTPTLKMRSSVRPVSIHKFVSVPKRKLHASPVICRKKRRVLSCNLTSANRDLYKNYPRHVFMKDLEDFLRECRTESEKQSIKTDSINFWEESDRYSNTSSDCEAMVVDESPRLDYDGAIKMHFSKSDKLEEENSIPASFSAYETNDAAGCGYGKTTLRSNHSYISRREGNSFISTELTPSSSTDVTFGGFPTSSEDGTFPNDLFLKPSSEQLCSGIGQPKSDTDSRNKCYFDHTRTVIPKKKLSSDYAEELKSLEEQLEFYKKVIDFKTAVVKGSSVNSSNDDVEDFRSILTGKEKTQHPKADVETEPRNDRRNTFYSDRSFKLFYKMQPSKIFYKDLREKLEMNRKLKFECPALTDSGDIHFDVVEPCDISPSCEKETCFDLDVGSSEVSEKSDSETVEYQEEYLLSEVPSLQYLANRAIKLSGSNVNVLANVLPSGTSPSKPFKYFNVCSEFSKKEVRQALEYISRYSLDRN